MLTLDALLSALLNVVLLAGIPFLVYAVVQRRRHDRPLAQIVERSGLKLGETKYLGYCVVAGAIVVAAIVLRPPSLNASTSEGSAFAEFNGLGLNANSVALALLYGVVKTGFAEEFLFRGLIAGSLSRHLPAIWANLIQTLIFLAPHFLVLLVAPELWPILPLVFVGALFSGWVRINSGSMVGPWVLHAMVNVAMALSVAVRSA